MSNSMYVSYILLLLLVCIFFSYWFTIPTLTIPHLDTHTTDLFHYSTSSGLLVVELLRSVAVKRLGEANNHYVAHAFDNFSSHYWLINKLNLLSLPMNGQVNWICLHTTLFHYTCYRFACFTSHTSSICIVFF